MNTDGQSEPAPFDFDAGPPVAWEDITPDGVDRKLSFGLMQVAVAPGTPTTVYLTTSNQGLWKSPDSGETWSKINTGVNGDKLDQGRGGAFLIDPKHPQTMYVTSAYGALGLWKSVNGGVDWEQLFSSDAAQNPTQPINPSGDFMPDIAAFDVDPDDPNHLIAAFHDIPWKGFPDAGFVMSSDGGKTWKLIEPPAGIGVGQCVFFLNDSNTWLSESASPGAGLWRTTNNGKTFTKVMDNASNHYNACQIYRTKRALYISSSNGVLRSADNGATWTAVSNLGGVQGIVGDGSYIYASGPLGNGMPYVPTQFAPERPGDKGWRFYGEQELISNANGLAADRVNHIIYAASWNGGAFRLVTR